MTGEEFEQWWTEYKAAFPGVGAWLISQESPAATLSVWRGALCDVEPEAASTVTRLMACGDIDPPAAYERERTAAIVRKHAKRIAFETRDTGVKRLKRRPNAPEQRFNCAICLDVGSVSVWHPDLVASLKRDPHRPTKRVIAAVACACPRGRFLAEPPEGKTGLPTYRKTPVYDEAVHCKFLFRTTPDADFDDLLNWLLGDEQEARHAEFDAWNAGV